MYFSKFPLFLAKAGEEQKTIEDFFIRVTAGKNYSKTSVLLLDYVVKDMERVEDVAYAFYGNPEYHWVILLINEIVDPRSEWPLPDADVMTFVQFKYGSPTDTHHWRTVAGHFEISPYENLITAGTIEPVSNYQYELDVNEAKRKIKVLDPQYLSEFVNDFTHRVSS